MAKELQKLAEPTSRIDSRVSEPEEAPPLHPVLQLQRWAGNRAVAQLLASGDGDGVPNHVLTLRPALGAQRKEKTSAALTSTTPHVQRAADDAAAAAPPETEPTPSAAGPLIVADDAASISPNQMRKSEFLEQLRSTVCTTADAALAEAGQSTAGCPYIEQWLSYYSDQEPAHIERALRRYAPEANSATSAAEYIPAVSNRVREAARHWAQTGEISGVPDELRDMLAGGGGVLGALAGIGSAIGGALSAVGSAIGGAFSSIGRALFKRKEGEAQHDEQQTQPELRAGQPLDASANSRMSAAFGHDFSAVRVHTDPHAAGLSNQLNARAFTIGSDIAFGAGEYQPGTMIGDALLAHELAHVVQQGGGVPNSAQQKGDVASDESLEEEADIAAVGAVSSLWFGTRGEIGNIGRQASPQLRSGLQLQRCNSNRYPVVDVSSLPEGPIREAALQLSQSDEEVDRNTVQQLVQGRIHAYYFEDLTQPANINAILTGAGLNPAVYTVYQHPVSGANMFVQKNFEGFRPYAYPTDIFGFRSLSVARWKELLVHETSHAVNPVPSTPFEKFKDEFRAYWVTEFRHISNLDRRADAIRQHILRDYPEIKSAYDADPALAAAIDLYDRPEGDLTNVTGLTPPPATPAGH
jgi:hypothetical protein